METPPPRQPATTASPPRVEIINEDHIPHMERSGYTLAHYLMETGQPCFRRGMEIIRDICGGLMCMHDTGTVVCDLHENQILMKGNKLLQFLSAVHRKIGEPCIETFSSNFDGMDAHPNMDMFNLGLLVNRMFSKHPPPEDFTSVIEKMLSDDVEAIPAPAVIYKAARMALQVLYADEGRRIHSRKRKASTMYDDANIVHKHMMPSQKRRKFIKRKKN